jgi:PAS domain S-box-containing protein
MKKYLVLIPILLIAVSIIGFYMDQNIKIKEDEKKLSVLKEVSHQLDTMFKNHMYVMEDVEKSANVDNITRSTHELEHFTKTYLDLIESMNYTRLYSLAKIIRSKTDKLSSVYEDIKTDTAVMNTAKIWAINNFDGYINANKTLTYENRSYIKYLIKAAIDNKYRNLVNIKNVRYADDLNNDLLMIQAQEKALVANRQLLRDNDIRYEVNEVILFTFKKLDELRTQTDAIVKKLLIGSMLMLLFAIGMYARAIKSLAETSKLKNELSEFVHALDESAIVSKSDLKGNITYVNDKFCDVTGYSREQLIGKSHSIVRHPDMPVGLFKRLWDTIEDNRIFKGTIKNKAKDGSVYYVDTTIVPLHNEEGKVDEYLSVRYNVTNFYKEFDGEVDQRKGDRGL